MFLSTKDLPKGFKTVSLPAIMGYADAPCCLGCGCLVMDTDRHVEICEPYKLVTSDES